MPSSTNHLVPVDPPPVRTSGVPSSAGPARGGRGRPPRRGRRLGRRRAGRAARRRARIRRLRRAARSGRAATDPSSGTGASARPGLLEHGREPGEADAEPAVLLGHGDAGDAELRAGPRPERAVDAGRLPLDRACGSTPARKPRVTSRSERRSPVSVTIMVSAPRTCARRASARAPGSAANALNRYGRPGKVIVRSPSGISTKKPRARRCSSCEEVLERAQRADRQPAALALVVGGRRRPAAGRRPRRAPGCGRSSPAGGRGRRRPGRRGRRRARRRPSSRRAPTTARWSARISAK